MDVADLADSGMVFHACVVISVRLQVLNRHES